MAADRPGPETRAAAGEHGEDPPIDARAPAGSYRSRPGGLRAGTEAKGVCDLACCKVIASFSEPVIAGFYLLANLALGVHLYHGVWSLFQSLGINNRRFNHWRRAFAVGFTAVVVIGNLSFPIAVQLGVVT